MANIDDILGQVKLPEKSVAICLRADLQAEFEDLERQLKAAREKPAQTLAGDGGEALAVAEKIEALRGEMRQYTSVFHLRALSKRAWSDLLAKHPAKPGSDGDFDPETFPLAVLAACCVDPAMSEDQAGQLVDRVSQGQWNDLWVGLINLNVGSTDVPFSVAASAILTSTKRN